MNRKKTMALVVSLSALLFMGCSPQDITDKVAKDNGTNTGGGTDNSHLRISLNDGSLFGYLDTDNTTILTTDGNVVGHLEVGTQIVSDVNGVDIAVCESLDGNVNFVDGVLVGECTLDTPQGDFYTAPEPQNNPSSSSSSTSSSTSSSSSTGDTNIDTIPVEEIGEL